MASKDRFNRDNIATLVVPAVITATNTATAIDMQGFESLNILIATGVVAGAGNFTPTLEESNIVDSGFTTVAAADLLGAFVTPLVASTTYKVGYRGNRRFVRTVLTLNSGTSIVAGVLAVRGNAANKPVA